MLEFAIQSLCQELDDELRALNLSADRCSALSTEVRFKAQHEMHAKRIAPANLLLLARHLHKVRMRGNEILGARLLSDPKYEMLLTLFIAYHEKKLVTVTDLCLASNVPATTGLRHIEKLERQGFLSRRPDENDARRTWIEPTSKAIDRTTVLLTELHQGF